MRIGIYGGFPPPICGQTLNNRVIANSLVGKGYEVRRYNTVDSFNKVGKFSFSKVRKGLKLAWHFYKDIKDIDVIYTTIGQSRLGFLKFYPMLKICKIHNIPYIVHLQGNMLPITFSANNFLMQRMILDVLQNSKNVIVLSESIRKQSLYCRLKNVEVVHNFVEDDYFISYCKKETFIKERPIRILYLSNLIRSKGILDLLKAALILKNKGVNFYLEIAGLWNEEAKKEGQKLIDNIGPQYVRYLGVVTGEEKKKLIYRSHMFILPTYYPQEGVPISILEAMAAGNVIITTRHSGIPDIVSEGRNGYFVEKKSPDDIAYKICYFYDNFHEIKLISQNNIEHAKEFTVEKFTHNIERILRKAVEGSY